MLEDQEDGDDNPPVLDLELDGDLEALPLLGGLGDVISDLLGGQAEGTDLGGQGAGEGVNSVKSKISSWCVSQ